MMLQKNNIYLGDCLEVMKQIDDHSIDMILCDLPYGITSFAWDLTLELPLLWWQYKRIIKRSGAIVLTATQPFASKLIQSNPDWFRHEIIWEKDNGTNFASVKYMPFRCHENILIFCNKNGTYNPQMSEGKPYSIKKCSKKIDNAYGMMRTDIINQGTRYPRSVVRFSSDKGLHPTQKPVALFEWLIRTYSNEGDLILDNCSGSGTTAIASINTKRDYILIEKDEQYFNKSKDRIENHQIC